MYLTWPAGVHTLDAFDARVSRKGEKKKVPTVWGRRPRVDKVPFVSLYHIRDVIGITAVLRKSSK